MDVSRCSVFELRQYTLRPGRRDVLIELFDREFVESQEAEGMSILGQFRDLDDPDRFVWIRGFDGMEGRAEALEGFYGGPVWREHREAANATMVDSDDVLLLRAASEDGGFAVGVGARPAPGEPAPSPGSVVLATIWYGREPFDAAFADFFRRHVLPVLDETGGEPLAHLRSEHAPNTFPALPVRLHEEVFVWFARFAGEEHLDRHLKYVRESGRWRDEVRPVLAERFARGPQRLRLAPTGRSALR